MKPRFKILILGSRRVLHPAPSVAVLGRKNTSQIAILGTFWEKGTRCHHLRFTGLVRAAPRRVDPLDRILRRLGHNDAVVVVPRQKMSNLARKGCQRIPVRGNNKLVGIFCLLVRVRVDGHTELATHTDVVLTSPVTTQKSRDNEDSRAWRCPLKRSHHWCMATQRILEAADPVTPAPIRAHIHTPCNAVSGPPPHTHTHAHTHARTHTHT